MTVQTDSLAQAQRAAVAALAKRYIAGKELEANVPVLLDTFGLTDELEQEQLIACWSYLKEAGVAPVPEPQSYSARRVQEPATDAQQRLIAKLCDEQKLPAPNGGLTKETAHEVIDSLKNGSYDPDKWTVPF